MTLLRLIPATATHRGMRRRNNEDAVGYNYPASADVLLSHGALFVVADGVGGLSAGDEASQMTVTELIKTYYQTSASETVEDRLKTAVEACNKTVYETLNRTGATTLIAGVILEDQLVIVSAGDSLAFRISDETIAQINEEDIVRSDAPENGALTKAIGYRETIEVEPIRLTLQPNEQLLLCSDGLTRYLNNEQLVRLAQLRDPRDSVRRMINQANAAGGADNISVIVVNVGQPIEVSEVAAHIAKMSVRVAVDTDPMMMQDVPSKPTTQIPMARPVASVDESLLNETLPEPRPQPTPQSQSSPQPVAQQKSGDNTLIVLIVVGVALLLIGGVIFGIAFASLNNGNATTAPIDVTPLETTGDDAPQSMLTNPSEVDSGLQAGDTILLDSNIMTKNGVGSDVDAFLALSDTPYLINTITQDGEGHSWYRLVDDNTDQVGWVSEDNLPAYQLQTD